MKTALSSIVLFLCAATFGFGQGSLTPPGAPAPTMKSLLELSNQIALLQSPNATQKFTAFATANATSTGGGTCTSIPIAAGNTVKLESVGATISSDAGGTAYLKFAAKININTSQLVVQNIPVVVNGSDGGINTRSGILQIPMWVTGGTSVNASIGEVHSLQVCVQSSVGSAAQSSFVLTGSYAP